MPLGDCFPGLDPAAIFSTDDGVEREVRGNPENDRTSPTQSARGAMIPTCLLIPLPGGGPTKSRVSENSEL